jgi:hypothetical protein
VDGSFGAHGLSPAAIKDVIAEIRSITSRPFAMNLWVSMEVVRSFEVACAEPTREQSHMQFEWKLQLRHFSGEGVSRQLDRPVPNFRLARRYSCSFLELPRLCRHPYGAIPQIVFRPGSLCVTASGVVEFRNKIRGLPIAAMCRSTEPSPLWSGTYCLRRSLQ